ncbi:MAG: LCP family protein [Mycobacteriales bacterium]|nr:LCP family protein [Frankia sp.]
MPQNPHGLVTLPPELNPRGPAVRRPLTRPRRRRWVRVMSWVAVGMSFTILLVSATGYALYHKWMGGLGRIKIPGLNQVDGKPAPPSAAQNYLLVGSDSREGATPEELRAALTEYEAGQRADTMILAHLSSGNKKAILVSFPRDAWVEIPDYTNPKTGKHYPAHMGKLNSSYSIGGAELAVKTIQNLTGIGINHYLEVEFQGFQRMVDALGGVTVCVSKPAHDHFSGINLDAGTHHVGGVQALAFVRQRHGLPRGDIDRIARQQYFLGAMLRKAISKGVLLNVPKLDRFMTVATHSVTADQSLSGTDILKFARKLRGLDAGHVLFVTTPVLKDSARRSGQSVVLLDDPAAASLFATIRNDEAVTANASPAPAAPPTDLVVRPGSIRVRVLNGTGTSGIARRAADDLARVGFQIRDTGNADAPSYAETIVRYGPSRADSARTLQAAVVNSRLQLDQSLGRTLELVIGTNYQGVRPVTVGPRAPTTTAPKPNSTPVPKSAADQACAP